MNYDEVGYVAADTGQRDFRRRITRCRLPSYAEVTSLDSGKTILVRLERRGPMNGNASCRACRPPLRPARRIRRRPGACATGQSAGRRARHACAPGKPPPAADGHPRLTARGAANGGCPRKARPASCQPNRPRLTRSPRSTFRPAPQLEKPPVDLAPVKSPAPTPVATQAASATPSTGLTLPPMPSHGSAVAVAALRRLRPPFAKRNRRSTSTRRCA